VFFVLPALGTLIGLLAFGWFLYLLWTTYSSPTKQGFHDKFANTMVVKAARSAADPVRGAQTPRRSGAFPG
jgi:uncharacterized RDD family membrane protein YckC